jgi:hypothetical protein
LTKVVTVENELRKQIERLERKIAEFPHKLSRRLEAVQNHYWEFDCTDGDDGDLPLWAGESFAPLYAANEKDKAKLVKLQQKLERIKKRKAA